MITLITISALIALYLLCYKTPLRYKTPFKYISYHKDLYERKHKVKLTYHFDRARYFGLGFTYNRDVDFRYMEATGETMVMKTYIFTLHFLFASFVLTLWRPYGKKE